MNQTESKVFVIYIGVAGIRSEDYESYIKRITEKISPISIDGEIITIPVNSYDTRIECINPKYVTDEELVNKHTNLMKELHKELEHQIKQLREENEGNK